MKNLTPLTALATLIPLAAALLLLAACTKPAAGPLTRGEIPDALRAAFVQVEITPQSSEGEEPLSINWAERCPDCGNYHANSLADAMRQERPATKAAYLVAPDLVLAPDACVPLRFVREWRVRQGGDTVAAHPVAWAADRGAMLLKLEKPLPSARPLEFAPPAKNAALASHFAIRHTGGEHLKISISPLSGMNWQIASSGERAHPVPPNSVITTAAGSPVALAPSETVPTGDAWKTPWRFWPWIYEDDSAARLEKLSATAAPALIHADIKLRPLPVRPGDNPYAMSSRPEDDPSTKPQPAIVLAPRRVLVLTPLSSAHTARLENVSLRLPGNTQVNAHFIASLADYGAFVVEPEHDIEAPLALPAAAPDWSALRDRLLLTIDLRLQGETRLARPGLTRIVSDEPGWRNAPTPKPADQSNTLFLFDLDGNLLGCPLVPRLLDTSDNRYGFRPLQTQRTVIVAASTLAAFTGETGAWADPSNIPVSEAEERQLVWLGVELQPLTRELAQAQGVAEQTQNGSNGGLVTKVYPDSPAAGAGLQTGDVLLRMRRENIAQIIPIRAGNNSAQSMQMLTNPNQQIPDNMFDRIPPPWPVADNPLNQKLKEIGAGKVFEIDYARDGVFSTVTFTAEKGPAYFGTAPESIFADGGLNVKALTFETRSFYKIPDDKSALIVSRVVAGSRASVAGLRPYDLIIEVNDQPVTTPAAFSELAQAGGTLRLLTRRMSQTRIVTLDVSAAGAGAPAQ